MKINNAIRRSQKQRGPERPIVSLSPKPWSIFLDWMSIFKVVSIIFWLELVWNYVYLLRKKYMFTSRRFRIISGIFNKKINEIRLFRVVDVQIETPFLYRFWSLANLHVYTRDVTDKYVVIEAISSEDAFKLMDTLQGFIEIEREWNQLDPPGYWK